MGELKKNSTEDIMTLVFIVYLMLTPNSDFKTKLYFNITTNPELLKSITLLKLHCQRHLKTVKIF